MSERWLIYGAYGFTGQRIAAEAVRRGERPVLAGRSEAKLAALAERLELEYLPFGLDNLTSITRAIRDYGLVLHCAGPYVLTSEPMVQACTLVGAHYLDLTGEISVYEKNYAYEAAARRSGAAVISGVGFDVLPSDCLACLVAGEIEAATELEIAFRVTTRASAGTAISVIENGAAGGWVRRGGRLRPMPMGGGVRRVRFASREAVVMAIPWGDLSTAWRSTGVPNLTTYMALGRWLPGLLRVGGPVGQAALSLGAVRGLLKAAIPLLYRGPSEDQQANGRAEIWARARNEAGDSAEGWLETPEPYRFTALAAVAAAQQVLATAPAGVLTPAQALGAEFVLGIEGVRRVWPEA